MSRISETRGEAGRHRSTPPTASVASRDVVDATETTSTSKDDVPYNPVTLSTDCLVKCIVDAYANDGDATVMALCYVPGESECESIGWETLNPNELCGGDYEIVVINNCKYDRLIEKGVPDENPLSHGVIDDNPVLEGFETVERAGFKVLA